MGLNSHERFENHMDVSSPETFGDAERMENISEDAYDDLFEERLACASKHTRSESEVDYNQDYGESNADDERNNRKSSTGTKIDYSGTKLGLERECDTPKHFASKEARETSEDIIFEGTAEENPQFGEGGGKQYFIRSFGDMTRDGRMRKIDEEKLDYTGSLMNDTRSATEVRKQEYQYDHNIDISPLTDEEKAEWAQLDEETRSELGLSRVMPDIESQIIEDRQNPWSDQENSRGSFYPDAYSDPQELQVGDTYYQLRPVNAKYDSPYVTDEKTIDACRGKNGEVEIDRLLQKLQIKPLDAREYILTHYIYKPDENRDKTGL